MLACKLTLWPESSGPATADEYRLKAGFLFHFSQLVDWPDASGDDSASFVICTLGGDVLQGGLEAVVAGKSIGSRPVRVLHLKTPEEIQVCQVLFVSAGERTRAPVLLARLKNAPVLTVGEVGRLCRKRGHHPFCAGRQEAPVRRQPVSRPAHSLENKFPPVGAGAERDREAQVAKCFAAALPSSKS
jgi:YfiR/HmsC-like